MAALNEAEVDNITVLMKLAGGEASTFQTNFYFFPASARFTIAGAAAKHVRETVARYLFTNYPDDQIVAEDPSVRRAGTSGVMWIITPLDGLANFARGLPCWSVGVARCDMQGKVLLNVTYFPATFQMLVNGDGIKSTLNYAELPKLLSPSFSPPIVAVGQGGPNAIGLFPPIGDQGPILDYGCSTYSLLKLALGEVDGYCSRRESVWTVKGLGSLILDLGGTCVYFCEKVDLYEEFQFVCGNPHFMASGTVLNAPKAEDQ